jgi:mono/diheme cytochrome c family protein
MARFGAKDIGRVRRGLAGGVAGVLVFALASTWMARAAPNCPEAPGDWRAGGEIYHRTCVTCHGEDGHGARRGVPDFTTGVMAYSSDSLAAHIEHGFRAPGRVLAMPPKGGNPGLTAEDIRNLLAYLHHAFGCG